jgi:transcription initiation factor TFIIIB Brf1 subunit/transcription initiation factor TFIIB
LECHNCGGNTIVYPEGLSGEKICSNCGLVIDETPTFKNSAQWTPEWYSSWSEKDSETLKEWLTTLRAVSCQLNIPNFPYREEAARTIRKQNHFLFKSQKLSKNKRATIAALMHLILKEYDKMRPIKTISKQLSLDNRAVTKHAWLLNKTLNGKQEPTITYRKTAIDYLHEYAGKITKDKELIITAERTLMKTKRSGGNPIGLAAGAFYNACRKKKIRISKEKIGETFHISKRTVYTNEARIRKLVHTTATATASSTAMTIFECTNRLHPKKAKIG